jgi:hypothetical protein
MVDIPEMAKVLSRVDAMVGLYVAVGNVTTFFPARPNVYLAVTLDALYGSVVVVQVYAITGDTANRQNAAINTNAKVTFFIHTPLFTEHLLLMEDIFFL